MTKPHAHPTLHSVSLRVWKGPGSLTWAITHRTARGAQEFDRRVRAATVRLGADSPQPGDLLDALYLALRDAYDRAGRTWPEATGAPWGASGEARAHLRSTMEHVSGVSVSGLAIDTDTVK